MAVALPGYKFKLSKHVPELRVIVKKHRILELKEKAKLGRQVRTAPYLNYELIHADSLAEFVTVKNGIKVHSMV